MQIKEVKSEKAVEKTSDKKPQIPSSFRRIGMEQVKVEFMLTALGYNIRKFLRYCEKGVPVKYWTAPKVTVPEIFKKLRLNVLKIE